MLKKLFETLPFFHHQPPLSIPLRKIILLAIQRPINLKQMEKLISQKLEKNERETIDGLENGIAYLRKERFFKKDSSNLFVAGLRAICLHDLDLGIEFGEKYIHELPDMRAIRSMVTFYGRAQKYDETLQLLNHVKNKNYAGEIRERTLSLIHPEIKEEKNDNSGPEWTFSLINPIKLNKKTHFFKNLFKS